ncbi:Img2-domain-containing protein [Trematosphaeria pertusa]|uniref:Large ribosomal subunit protein mL49 n=1 Tax=Trematosphaeria pertusa TaxID=390896 RepID=A0A6A6HWR0_9PLEO|nr:Img2-domain-containing protein [Trematosphaeria pertusa]KAF2242003.1 Img2-domain-containing protein [Trematosphaeria pertusa]
MPRIQSLLPLLRPLAAPRRAVCQQLFRFSTATRLRVEQPSAPTSSTPPPPPTQKPSATSPEAPSTAQEASKAADLAATEAATDADSAQSPAPKPNLPSKRAEPSKPENAEPADDVKVSSRPAVSTETTTAELKVKAKSFKTVAKGKKANGVDDVKVASTRASPTGTTTSELQSKAKSFKTVKKAKKPQEPRRLQLQLPPPKYHIARSASKNLPIYTDYKRGGNLHLTTIRKVTGDISALRDELRVFLNKKNEEVKINSLTQHVIVKGHHVPEVTEFLKARGM